MSSNGPMLKLVWLSIALIAVGLLTRWEQVFANIHEGTLISIPGFVVLHSKGEIFSLAQLIDHFMHPSLWGIWGLLLAAHILAMWKGEPQNHLRPSLVVTLYLLAGALLSLAIDLLFFNGLQNTFQIELAGLININLNLSGLVLVVGISYLSLTLINRNCRLRSQYRLTPCRIPKVQISALPRGVDNIHIDVLLSRKFCRSSNLCIRNLLPIVVRELQAGKRRVRIPENQLKPLHNIFAQMVEQTLRRAKESSEKEIVELLVIAVFKYIQDEVDRSVDAYVRHGADTRHDGYQPSVVSSKSEQSFVEYLSCYKEAVSATVNEIILNSLSENHLLPFHKALKSFLGIKDSFSIRLIQAPLALCGYHHSEQMLLNNYLLTGILRKESNHFYKVENALATLFQPYLSLLEQEPDDKAAHPHEEILNERMELLLQPSIFMETRNLKKLLDVTWTKQNIEHAIKEGNRANKRKLKRHLQFQQGIINRLEKAFRPLPISRWLVASYQVKEILSQSASDISPSALINIIVNSENKIELEERAAKNSISGRFPEMALVNSAWDIVHADSAEFVQDNFLRMLKDFSRYRRDLLIQAQLQQGYNHIKLLTDKRDIQTSRANYTLHDFSISSELNEDPGQVRSHIIIKADLRGSTQVTDKLVGLALNPASHFERNFFTPVNELIELYGAEKVFIEGDAIILILNDHEGKNSNHHIASRACGLAANILKVVAKQNLELKCYGLPELELGIGVSYSESSPRYLFDVDHRITISPAINRADRLSACTWSVREWREKQAAPMNQVEVYQPSASAEAVGTKAQKDMVFNLNGILIEEEVFDKLQQEVNLKRVMNKITTMQDSKLFSLVFPDLSGSVHRMIVRKAPIKIYDQSFKVDECPVVDKRFFYEVVYQQEVLDQLRK